jgi:hypothetical protein
MAVAFGRRVIQNILHRNVNQYSGWSMDIVHDARVVANIRFLMISDQG